MIAKARFVLTAAAVAVLAGCAHPIVIAPDIAAIKTSATPVIDKKAGYFISAENRELEVTTPGGGGDKIRYFPYRDLETGLYKVLSGTFTSVTRLGKAPTAEILNAEGLAFAITPKITTQSNSDSIVTWPPTSFTVELECRTLAESGSEIATTRVVGFGNATFDEFKSDFALAAKRASTDALNKLSTELGTLEALRK